MKLTDTQLALLSAASRRNDRALERPANLTGGSAAKAVTKLLAESLIEEVQARGGLPVWRRDNERTRSLRITKKGVAAIRIEDGPVERGDNAPIKKPPAPSVRQPQPAKTPARTSKGKRGEPRRSRAGSKQAHVVALLSRPQGATIGIIMKKTGWQQHSVRGFLAAVVRKKLALTLVSQKDAGGRVYRIVRPNARRKAKTKSFRRAA